MTVALGHAEFLLPPSAFHRRSIPSRQHQRAWKHRRLKPLAVHNHLNPTPSPFHNLFHSLLSQFPSVNSLSYIAPTLGFASGLALFFSYNSPKLLPYTKSLKNSNSDIGEWILFTSPTPFNRFVTLRCPSIYFPGNELLENVNEKLIKEERHYVKLNSGRMIKLAKIDGDVDENMVYQRICVATEDGGVLSFDWPANLDLEEERGMDTTVLIVPGTAEGSNEKNVRVFVCGCLRRGVFPVVMNPRGCAGSPLTTARLFTAADSDDISTAVQYINKKRPWTTLMGVGWGYGANMLTKYLAEFGERTPLTAATCIDNPFDLEEVTRSSLYHMDFDRKHTDGLIKILQCNKGLFQGRGKRFDVERALSASSIRDFEAAISMVSYGFDTIEDFYVKCSTRDVVGKVKIPVLFIQNDDGKIPLFSIPRSLIAENPYTSLLLCSYSPLNKVMDDRPTFSWCQNLTLEWLTAVELGLLKGRHPLLKDVDVTINPSNGLALVESKTSSKRERLDKFLNFTSGSSGNPQLKMFQANDTPTSIQSRATEDTGELSPTTRGLHQGENDVGVEPSAAINAGVEEEINSFDDERGHVLQTAEVVMNMLDMTMPDTLSDEQKKKVLNAVGQGETLIKALQDAVPEEVRGKLTTAVSGILQSHGSNLKFGKLLSLGHVPDVASGLKSKVPEKTRLTKTNDDEEVHSLEQKKRINDPGHGSTMLDHSSNKPPADTELENQSSEITQKPNDTGMHQSTRNRSSRGPDLEKANQNDKGNSIEENEQLSGSSTAQISDRGNRSEINADQESSRMSERPGGGDHIVADQKEVERESGKGQPDPTEENNKRTNDSSTDQNKVPGAYHTEDKSSAPSLSSETQMKENESENNQGKEEKGPMPISIENSGDHQQFSVSQALDALTGFDDSTQVAVNSVFNVIEDMIDQLEVHKDNENNASEVHGTGEVKELSDGSVSKNHLTKNEHEYEGTVDLRNNARTQSDNVDRTLLYDPAGPGDKYKQQHVEHDEHSNNSSRTNNTGSQLGTENETRFVPAAGELQVGNFVKYLDSISEKAPSYPNTFPYGDPLYKEYLKRYLYLKMRNAKPLDQDKMSALYLDYIPEEGQWKLLEQTEENSSSVDEHTISEADYGEDQAGTQPTYEHTDNIIEPSYVILDSSKPQDQNEELKGMDIVNNFGSGEVDFGESVLFIKSLVLECLKVEVGRRASVADMEELKAKLAMEIESVANAVSIVAQKGKLQMHEGNDDLPDKIGTLDGENIIKAISSAVQDTRYLRRILPVGVVVGARLASLRKFFNVAALDGSEEKQLPYDQVDKPKQRRVQIDEKESSEMLAKKKESKDYLTSSICEEEDDPDLEDSKNNEVMVGAVTAALGASALLAHQSNTDTDGASSEPLREKGYSKDPSKLDEMPGKSQNNIVTSLAEKAMSVASPVVPIKEDGEVDHERLVAMLAELGQRGGILRLVGKVALLWGGIRGAMSLTDKLISFLHIAERPLFQRILGFVSMVLLLWSPVILPLLPALMQSWTTHSPFKIAQFACIAGLYVSIMIMITLWGKRIRKYDDPLVQYGLDLASVPKFQNFLKGLIGGVILVILIHAVNSSLGCAHLCWPATLSSSSEPVALIKSYGRMLMLIVQGIATATGVSVVEELLFRSWLTQEIAADFGYHWGVVASALVFAFSQRSAWEIPGLWLLSLSLSGAQQRSQGSLSLPIGIRAGILASNFILKTGGFLTYQPNFPLWVTGGHPFHPFSGVVGLAFSLVLAVVLYPREPLYRRKTRVIRD
ncbi:Alpha/beta hydrolase [Handroanthus impetiginosus]|uniref:Alpha/beta hydrolase n=1 Tax=Handroanthus impetiginosus TaxID=429701 RepID=A0A2G9I8M1_9LAMI|nr:Alpha/beta hydrolase [Handroanthus impetiginosus]